MRYCIGPPKILCYTSDVSGHSLPEIIGTYIYHIVMICIYRCIYIYTTVSLSSLSIPWQQSTLRQTLESESMPVEGEICQKFETASSFIHFAMRALRSCIPSCTWLQHYSISHLKHFKLWTWPTKLCTKALWGEPHAALGGLCQALGSRLKQMNFEDWMKTGSILESWIFWMDPTVMGLKYQSRAYILVVFKFCQEQLSICIGSAANASGKGMEKEQTQSKSRKESFVWAENLFAFQMGFQGDLYTGVSRVSNPSSKGIVCKSKICAAISHQIRQPSPAAPSTCSSSMPSLEHWNGNETVLPADSHTMNVKMYHGSMDLFLSTLTFFCLCRGRLCEAFGSWLCGTSSGRLIAL